MKLNQTLRNAFVRAAMEDVPSLDYFEMIRVAIQKDAVEQLPPKVRAIQKDAALRDYIRGENIYLFGGYINVKCMSRHDFKPSPEVHEKCAEWHAMSDEQTKKYNELKTKLHQVAMSCTTRKQLCEMLPEFEKYLPEDEASANRSLPVVANVVSDFVKAGWPKNQKIKTKAV